MNFTREPIIETIITPKDGYKLIVRSSKTGSDQEYSVDAVEIVSFGNALFFRSQERPKPFLLPVSDCEVVEAKETRVVLKNASFDRSIKIGGGKEASLKASKEKEEQPEQLEEKLEKKRERRRHRRRKGSGQEEEVETAQPAEQLSASEGGGVEDETPVSSSQVARLIPPPPGLISDKYPKVAKEATATAKGDVSSEPVAVQEEEKEAKPKKTRRRTKSEPKKEAPSAKQPPLTGDKEDGSSSEKSSPQAEKEVPTLQQGSEKAKGEDLSSQSQGDVNRIAIEQRETVLSTSFSAFDPLGGEPFGKIW